MEMRDGPQRCDQCGVYFKNRAILHMHQMYRHGKFIGPMVSSDTDTEDVTNSGKSDTKPSFCRPGASENDGNTSSTPKEQPPSQLEDVQSPESLIKRRRTMSFNNVQTSSRTERMYRCPHFNYSLDERGSPIRHVRVHGGFSRATEATPKMARYCAKCNIQFKFLKNYQCHKDFYCNTRPVFISTSSSSPNTSQHQTTQPQTPPQTESLRHQPSPTDPNAKAGYKMVLNQPLHADISNRHRFLVPCSYVASAGSLSFSLVPAGNIVIPNPRTSSPDPRKNVISTFTVMPGAEANDVQPSEEYLKTKLSEAKDTSASKEDRLKIRMQKDDKYQDGGKDEDVPLDLGLREKEWNETSLPSRTMTESDLQRTSSPRDESSIPPNLPAMPPHNSELMETDSGLVSVLPPPILVKQCVIKCMDCNKVFYKHKNYLIHKSKYCVKNRKDSPDKSRDSSSTPD